MRFPSPPPPLPAVHTPAAARHRCSSESQSDTPPDAASPRVVPRPMQTPLFSPAQETSPETHLLRRANRSTPRHTVITIGPCRDMTAANAASSRSRANRPSNCVSDAPRRTRRRTTIECAAMQPRVALLPWRFPPLPLYPPPYIRRESRKSAQLFSCSGTDAPESHQLSASATSPMATYVTFRMALCN